LLYPVNSKEALCVERSPADEEGNHHSDCEHNNTLTVTVNTTAHSQQL
jgi:hypothetical protein